MNMPIITLGRQFGSGGRAIGHQLAEKWGIPCYDRELITLAAQKAEVHEELFTGKDEKAANPWLYTGVYEGGSKVQRGRPAEDILFDMQSQVILDLAQKGPCIIIGRCSDVVLRSAGFQIISLFVCAPFLDRVKRRVAIEGAAQKSIIEEVQKIDRQRKKYYERYTGRNWGTPDNYDFCINSSAYCNESAVSRIISLLVENYMTDMDKNA